VPRSNRLGQDTDIREQAECRKSHLEYKHCTSQRTPGGVIAALAQRQSKHEAVTVSPEERGSGPTVVNDSSRCNCSTGSETK